MFEKIYTAMLVDHLGEKDFSSDLKAAPKH
jgi:hypothetical protein